MEEQTTNESIKRLEERMDERFQIVQADIRELRADQKAAAKGLRDEIKWMQQTMLRGFLGLASFIIICAGFSWAG